MLRSLVGSEMCIRDRVLSMELAFMCDHASLEAHIKGLEAGSVATPLPLQLVQNYLDRAVKKPAHAQAFIGAAAQVCSLSRRTRFALTLDDIAGMDGTTSNHLVGEHLTDCLLYTSDAADEEDRVHMKGIEYGREIKKMT
eukprot:TRINITY_DN17431_c0_g1_i1.p1 TRINITY_DN17431_c0_g1~~TRINITY_DN17431_c0_g1_i1.p1  ORF type:complete len:140 (-),score=44.87 TRINITY_DN17431_c0_g1_i1:5-424(-)